MSADGYTEFGFRWGPADVTRCCTLPGDRRVIQIKTAYRTIDVYVSATGRSVRVFEHGNGELVAAFSTTQPPVMPNMSGRPERQDEITHKPEEGR